MKKIFLIFLILFVVKMPLGITVYGEEAKDAMEEGLSQKISLDLRGMDIVDTIKFLAVKGDLNIVTSKNVIGRVTLFLKDVTIADTLDIIVLTNKLAYVRESNIIAVMTETEYEELYGEKYSDKRGIKTLKLKYALPTKVGKVLADIKSSIGKVIMDDATGIVILIDTPEKIEEMAKTAFDLDKGLVEKKPPTVSKVFELNYAKAEDISTKISEALTEDIGSVRTDERTNKVIVNDLPNKMEEIEEMIAAFDSRTKEVFIEAKIVEVTLDDDFDMGVNWEKLFAISKDLKFISSFPSGLAGSYGLAAIGAWREGFYTDEGTEDEEWQPGAMSRRESREIFTILRDVGKVRVISSPHIAVCNNEEAKIMVGSRQPYATSTISQGETTDTTSWSAEFVDIGVTITVTPTISEDGFVKMHIKPEVSTLTDWFEIEDDSGDIVLRLPEVDTSNAETDVLIKSGRTIIIAGLIKEYTSETEKKIPILGDVPMVGHLFKSTSDDKQMKELVIFLTPHIISGGDDMLYVKQTEKVRKPEKR